MTCTINQKITVIHVDWIRKLHGDWIQCTWWSYTCTWLYNMYMIRINYLAVMHERGQHKRISQIYHLMSSISYHPGFLFYFIPLMLEISRNRRRVILKIVNSIISIFPFMKNTVLGVIYRFFYVYLFRHIGSISCIITDLRWNLHL